MNAISIPFILAAALAGGGAFAQKPPAPAPAPAIEGKTFDGKAFNLASLRGKVVLLMYWNTDCAVCRDKMPELRQNYEGWKGKPFEMVLVSTDRRLADVEGYEKVIARTVPSGQRFVQMWAGDPAFRDNLPKPSVLPASYLLDKSGKVVERYQGRIPAEAWDRIAELL